MTENNIIDIIIFSPFGDEPYFMGQPAHSTNGTTRRIYLSGNGTARRIVFEARYKH